MNVVSMSIIVVLLVVFATISFVTGIYYGIDMNKRGVQMQRPQQLVKLIWAKACVLGTSAWAYLRSDEFSQKVSGASRKVKHSTHQAVAEIARIRGLVPQKQSATDHEVIKGELLEPDEAVDAVTDRNTEDTFDNGESWDEPATGYVDIQPVDSELDQQRSDQALIWKNLYPNSRSAIEGIHVDLGSNHLGALSRSAREVLDVTLKEATFCRRALAVKQPSPADAKSDFLGLMYESLMEQYGEKDAHGVVFLHTTYAQEACDWIYNHPSYIRRSSRRGYSTV